MYISKDAKIMILIVVVPILCIAGLFSSAFASDNATVKDWYEKGKIALQGQKHDEAISAFTKAIDTNPAIAECYFYRGIAHGNKGEWDIAINDYTKAIELDKKVAVFAYNNRGLAYEKKGQLDLAIEDYSQIVQLHPKFGMAYDNRGHAYERKGQKDLALKDLRKAAQLGYEPAQEYLKSQGISWK